MAVRDGTLLGGTKGPPTFRNSLHAEEDTTYWQTMPGYGVDRWFWGQRLSPNTQGVPISRPYAVTVRNAAREGMATVRVRLKGYTGQAHHTRVHLNDHLIDDQTWQGQIQFTHAVSVPQSFLQDGENIVVVEAASAGASIDQVLVNWIEIDYWDQYIAEDDQLAFGAPADAVHQEGSGNVAAAALAHQVFFPILSQMAAHTMIEVGGFVEPMGIVLDVTEPVAPVRIIVTWAAGADGRNVVRFTDREQPGRQYLAVTARHYKTPVSLALDTPSSWQSPANAADYIIITHEAFYDAVAVLAEHRRGEGLRVVIVKVGDIYDEFSHGLFSPEAIHAFLRYAYQH